MVRPFPRVDNNILWKVSKQSIICTFDNGLTTRNGGNGARCKSLKLQSRVYIYIYIYSVVNVIIHACILIYLLLSEPRKNGPVF